MTALARTRADESVATRFSRVMNATSSPWGVLTDPPIIAVPTAILAVVYLAALRVGAAPELARASGALALAPLLVALVVTLRLRSARARVVDWLASLPFPIENLNAVLNGLGDTLEITFVGARPTQAELNLELDRVSPDAFVTHFGEVPPVEGTAPVGRSSIEVRIGVVDSKHNPARSNHQRFRRVQELVGSVLVPLHARFPIIEVRVK